MKFAIAILAVSAAASLTAQSPTIDEPAQETATLYLPPRDIPRVLPVVTYHVNGPSAERAKYEAQLVHLLHENLAKEQAGIVDMDLRQKIRRLEVKIEAAQ